MNSKGVLCHHFEIEVKPTLVDDHDDEFQVFHVVAVFKSLLLLS